jgi:Putative peptidoglycan binding domain/Penicillin-insensitive murein endopeptidase
MSIQSPHLFEAPLVHEVGRRFTPSCTCPECRVAYEYQQEWEVNRPAVQRQRAVSNSRVNTMLPPSPLSAGSRLGYVTSKPSNRQFGQPEAIRALQAIAAAWLRVHPNGPYLDIRDISFQGGGPMNGHISHQQGIDVDIRPIRRDGQQGLTTFNDASSYSQVLTRELVELIHANLILKVEFILFNDPALRPRVRPWHNHDDHLHVRFVKPGGRPTTQPPQPAPPAGNVPTVRRGSRGDSVRTLQTRLNIWFMRGGPRHGLEPLVVDGIFGPRTESAVRTFQQTERISVDGVVGRQTWARLLGQRPVPVPLIPPQPPTPPSSSVPAFVGSEKQPADTTLYVNIPLGSEGRARAMTGIFISEKYHTQPAIDIVLFLHGYKTSKTRSTPNNPHPKQLPDPGWTIDQYWRFPKREFREAINASHKSVILVTPTLGQFSQTGDLKQPGGFDRYIDQVMAALVAYGPYKGQTPRVGNIILAAHSGGGYPMRMLARSNQRYTSSIRECWGYDCTYNPGDDKEWAAWAEKNPGSRLFIYYIRNTRTRNSDTAKQAELLRNLSQSRGLSNVSVIPSSTSDHDSVPITYWQTNIETSPFLSSR